ncbi:MAG: tetratricopeptide repeat protein, partial [Planctomycetota bacterium]
MIASRLLWLAVLVPSVQEDGNLTVGDSLQAELSVDAPLLDGRGAAVRHELAVSADGWVTITLHSLDFDALLRLERLDGELLAEDDNGGTQTDARLCLRLEAGTSYRLTAAAARPAEGGEYQLTAATGQPEELSGAEQLDAAIEFRTRAAERARERDQLASAAGHLLELGTHQLLRARINEASATWEQVRSLATELGDEKLDARAMARLSESLLAAGHTARARELAQEALAFHVDTGDVREEGIAVRALASVHHLLGEQARSIELFERLEEIAGELDDQHMLGQALYGLATSLQFLGRSDEAADRLQEAREIFHEVGDPSGEARVLNSVAMASSARRDYLQARDQFEAAVELFQESGDQASEAMALANLGHTYQKMGAFNEALGCADEALGLAEATGHAQAVQWALCALGETYQSQGDFPRALEHHRARLEMLEREGNDWACSWANLGVAKALSSMGRLDEAVLHLDAAHGVASRRGDESLLGDLASARGGVLFFRWDFPAARAEYETQLSTAERLGDRKNQASALGGIAICEANLQEYERAGELLEQALWIYDELGDDSGMLWVRSNQADVFRHQGALTLAEEAYEEVLDLAERLDQPMQVPRAHFGLGSVRHDLGDFFRAQESFDRARTLALARADANTALQARLMLVDLRVHFCDYQAAIEGASTCLEQARSMGSTGDEHHALGLLAVSQLEQGDLGGAQMLYEQSLALEGGSARGPVLTNLGLIHLSLGEFEEARRRFQERLDLARRSGTPTGEAWALNGLARVAHELGEAEQGRELALEAYRISRRMGALDVRENILLTLVEQELAAGDAGSVRRRLREVERLLNRPTHRAAEVADSSRLRHRKFMWAWIAQDLTHLDLESAGERAVAQRRAIEEGFVRLGQWKSRGLLEGIVEHREGARSQEALRLRQERRTAELRRDSLFERMGARVAGGGSQAEIDDLRGRAEAAWARADELGEELARVSPRDAAVDLPRGVGPEAIRRRLLDAETVLIEYAQGLEHLYAYVISPGRLRHVDLGPRAEIEALAQEFLAAVSSPTEVSLGVLAELGRQLHETLLAPVLAT